VLVLVSVIAAVPCWCRCVWIEGVGVAHGALPRTTHARA